VKEVSISVVRARFFKYLSQVEAGETVVITRRNKPVAMLAPIVSKAAAALPRRIGRAKGRVCLLPAFFEPLDEELLDLFDGSRMLPTDPLQPDFEP
jgi:prevent-host-death family protein